MNLIFAILLIAVVLGWLLTKEIPMFFGVLVPTGSIKRVWFWGIVLVAMALAILMPWVGRVAGELAAPYGAMSVGGMALVVFAAFIALLLLESLGMKPSLCLALLGAFEGYRVVTAEGGSFDFSLMGGWIVAPLVSALLAGAIYAIYKATMRKVNIHFIKLAIYLRYMVVVGLVLAAVAVGVNQGALVAMLSDFMIARGLWNVVLPVILLVGCWAIFGHRVEKKCDLVADKYFDFSTQVVLAVTYAAAIALLLFSSDLVRLIGLRPAPQSVSMVVIGALLGVGAVSRRQIIEGGELYRMLFGFVLAPVVAIFCYMLLSPIMGADMVDSPRTNATIFVTMLLLVIVVVFARYVRSHEQLKLSTRKLLYSQQQQLFENQKALNDMELKAILAENQSLHGTLELKRQENINVALGISEQKEFLETMAVKVRRAAKSSPEEKDRIIAELENDLTQRIGSQGEVDEFYTQAELLHKDFSVKLTEEFPNLTPSERRLATLLRLGFSSKYIATLMNISPKSVEISRYRLRQKLGLQRGDNLIKFIKSI